MLRKFTKDLGRYKKGQSHDYPKAVWEQIAKSAKAKLDSFTEAVETNMALQNMMRGPVNIHKRLGT
ncbi:MAG: hypothetical protein U1E51_07900 [Candidatus Binatia bacterium]|nr:hypothetical protein [Candidatus Binatia bacterium]